MDLFNLPFAKNTALQWNEISNKAHHKLTKYLADVYFVTQ